MKSTLSTKEITETGIFWFFDLCSKMWKTGNKYNANRIRKRAKPWPTPISILKKWTEELFQKYLVFLPTR